MPSDLVQVYTKLPQGLVDALRNDKPIVFFIYLLMLTFDTETAKADRGAV